MDRLKSHNSFKKGGDFHSHGSALLSFITIHYQDSQTMQLGNEYAFGLNAVISYLKDTYSFYATGALNSTERILYNMLKDEVTYRSFVKKLTASYADLFRALHQEFQQDAKLLFPALQKTILSKEIPEEKLRFKFKSTFANISLPQKQQRFFDQFSAWHMAYRGEYKMYWDQLAEKLIFLKKDLQIIHGLKEKLLTPVCLKYIGEDFMADVCYKNVYTKDVFQKKSLEHHF